MPRFSEHARASYETPQLRRLAITALLILWPDGLTLTQLGGMLNTDPSQLSADLVAYTDQMPGVWQEDCPEACDDDICLHARLSLHNPHAAERRILDAASQAGFGKRKAGSRQTRSRPDTGPRVPQVTAEDLLLPPGTVMP